MKSDDFTKIKMRMCSKQGIKPITFNKQINDLSIMVSILYTWVSYQKCFLAKVQTALVGQNLVFDVSLSDSMNINYGTCIFRFEIPIYVFFFFLIYFITYLQKILLFLFQLTLLIVYSADKISVKNWTKD